MRTGSKNCAAKKQAKEVEIQVSHNGGLNKNRKYKQPTGTKQHNYGLLKNNATAIINYKFGGMTTRTFQHQRVLKLLTLLLTYCCITTANAGMAGTVKASVYKKALPTDAELYILCVGIDEYAMLKGKTQGSANDVKLLTDSITRQFQGEVGDTSSTRIHSHQLTDKNATRENIVKALQDVIKHIKRNDILFFSFSGHTFEAIPGSNVKLDYPYVATYYPDTNFSRKPEEFAKTFLGLKELRALLELMPNTYQFILFDACNEKDMAYKFASTMLADIPSEQGLSQRKRIFVAPKDLALKDTLINAVVTKGL